MMVPMVMPLPTFGFPPTPVRPHAYVFALKMRDDDFGEEHPLGSSPLRGKEDVRMLGITLVHGVFLPHALIPKLEVSNRCVAMFVVDDPGA